ncbi:gas vesicle protein GvpK [Promicromonospora sp. NPDC019610]|uniref:gas vesicle protein GvpK n=1 Tax=Promicromonospora sp. NPDC019610 TaxID=3364405 RepID=UPI0037BAF663
MEIDESNLKNGLLTLVVTLVEIIEEALESQAIRRLEGGELTEEEQERLGQALLDLDDAIGQIKTDHGLEASVADLRSGLDDVVDDIVRGLTAQGGTPGPAGQSGRPRRPGPEGP